MNRPGRLNFRRIQGELGVWPHYVTPARVVGFIVVGPPLEEDATFEDEADALEEAARRIAGYEIARVTINRIETHLEVIR